LREGVVFSRFSVDSFADVILSDVKRGAVSRKMLRRFYRLGKRDARREDHLPAKEYVTHGVSLAVSKICEEYVARRSELQRSVAEQEATAEKLRVELASLGPELTSVQQVASSNGAGAANMPGSLETLARRRRAREVEEMRRERERLESGIAEAQRAVRTLTDEIALLPQQFAQSAASCREVGSLLWARYCMGYEKGKRRRVAPDDRRSGPEVTLDSESPCDFGVGPASGREGEG